MEYKFKHFMLYILQTTDLLPSICTVSYVYYTKLLHVSAIYTGLLQGATSLVDVYSLSEIIRRLFTYIYIYIM